jgi:hypothetical protein
MSNLSVQHVTPDDCLQEDKHKEIKIFDPKLMEQLDDKNFVEIDEETGTEFWGRAINKEMSKVKVARKIHEGHTPEAV